MRLSACRFAALFSGLIAALHCGRRTEAVPAPAPVVVAPAPKPVLALQAAPTQASSSTLALGRAEGRLYAFVADEDAHALQVLDVERGGFVASLPLPAVPGHVVVHGAGLAVALRDTAEVRTVTLRGTALAPELELDAAVIPAPFDPLALASDGQRLAIVSASSATLSRDGVTTTLPRDPRAVLVTPDGTARISHATGSTLSTVLASGARTELSLDLPAVCTEGDSMECMTLVKPPSVQTYAMALYEGSVLVPSVSSLTDGPFSQSTAMPKPFPMQQGVDLGRMPSMLGGGPSSGAYGGGNESNPITFRIDVVENDPKTAGASALGRGFREGIHECTLPRGMAVDEATHQVWVACLGDGKVLRHEVKTTKKGLVVQKKDALDVPFVSAVAYDAPSARLLAHAPYDRKVTIALGSVLSVVAMPAVDLEPQWLAGRKLFATTDKRISGGKKACQSCHPDGGDDGLAWETPRGKRRTLSLVARPGVGNVGWEAKSATLHEHVDKTIRQNLRGKGLDEPELAALLRYVSAMKAPQSRPLEATALRGRALFTGAAECSTCHDPEHHYSDGLLHDVGGGSFRTPPLVGSAGRGRFFHDGRYRSLDELLAGTDGRMGRSAALSPEDRAALQSYLATL